MPQWTKPIPTFRFEFSSVGSPVVRVAMQEIPVTMDNVTFGDENGLLAVRASAAREGCIFGGDADHLDAIWHETMGCIHVNRCGYLFMGY